MKYPVVNCFLIDKPFGNIDVVPFLVARSSLEAYIFFLEDIIAANTARGVRGYERAGT
jgi:hypothetical protein